MSTQSKTIFIATRGSALALVQANSILAQCQEAFPDRQFEIQVIKTTGDKLQTASLTNQDLPKGLFTKELEVALLNNEAGLAVHSLKDLPTELPSGLTVGAVGKRADVRDVLVHKDSSQTHSDLSSLPKNATIATSSTRREAQLLHHRPDLKIVPIRGNVPTRLKKLAEQEELFGTILAAAGMNRLSYSIKDDTTLSSEKSEIPEGLRAFAIPVDQMLPCVGQAAIGIETRVSDPAIAPLCKALTDSETLACVTAERAFLHAMGGGCQLAVGAHATLSDESLTLKAISFLGAKPVSGCLTAPASNPTGIGTALAKLLAP